jgi:hypothetical protein
MAKCILTSEEVYTIDNHTIENVRALANLLDAIIRALRPTTNKGDLIKREELLGHLALGGAFFAKLKRNIQNSTRLHEYMLRWRGQAVDYLKTLAGTSVIIEGEDPAEFAYSVYEAMVFVDVVVENEEPLKHFTINACT